MTVLAAIAALATAACVGYYFGRRAGAASPPWKTRTTRIAVGRLAISLLALLAARRIRRSLRADHILVDAMRVCGLRAIAPLELLRGSVTRAR